MSQQTAWKFMEVVRSLAASELTTGEMNPNALYFLFNKGNVADRTEAIELAKAGIPVSKALS